MQTIQCNFCKKIKNINEFDKSGRTINGYKKICRVCVKEKREITIKKYRKSKNFRKRRLLDNARERAKEKNIKFNLTVHDFDIPDKCPILNIPLEYNTNKIQDNNPSIDRIDPKKGYIRDNIRIISRLANVMKQNANTETLKLFAKNIIPYIGENNNNFMEVNIEDVYTLIEEFSCKTLTFEEKKEIKDFLN